MAKDKKNYREKDQKELIKALKEVEKKLTETKMEMASGKIKDLHSPRKLRKEVARIKGVFRLKV